MTAILTWLFGGAAIISSAMSVFFSIRSRRAVDQRMRAIYAARMNICMGIMLIFIALVQMFLFEGSTVRVIIGAVFMLLGAFNLFAGIRNHGHFTRMNGNA